MERPLEPLGVETRPAAGERGQHGTAIHWYDGALHAWVTPPERGNRWTGLHAVAALPLEIPYGSYGSGSPASGSSDSGSPRTSTAGDVPAPARRDPARVTVRSPACPAGPAAATDGRPGVPPARPGAVPPPLLFGLTNACFNEVDRHVAAGGGDEAALVYAAGAGPRRLRILTRKQLLLAVVEVAHALAMLGLGAGDRVFLRLPPSPAAACYLAAAKRLGAVAVWAPPGPDEPAGPEALVDWAGRARQAGARVLVASGRDLAPAPARAGAPEDAALIVARAPAEGTVVPALNGRFLRSGGDSSWRVWDAGDLLAEASRTLVANARATGLPVADEADLLVLPDADLVRALWATSRPRPVPAEHLAWIHHGATGEPAPDDPGSGPAILVSSRTPWNAAPRGRAASLPEDGAAGDGVGLTGPKSSLAGTHASAAAAAQKLRALVMPSPGQVAVGVAAGDDAPHGPGPGTAWPDVPWPDAVAAVMTLGVTVVLADRVPEAGCAGDWRALMGGAGLRLVESAAWLLKRSAASADSATAAGAPVDGRQRRTLRLYSLSGFGGFSDVSGPGGPGGPAPGIRSEWVTPYGRILWTHLLPSSPRIPQ